jgi:hypothetical protein
MTAYVINEHVTDIELNAVQEQSPTKIMRWPAGTSSLPEDIEAAVLIIREMSTLLEESRAIVVVSGGIRIVCVYINEVEVVSELARKFCSAKVPLAGGGFGEALKGNDQLQQEHDGKDAPRNPQKPHNC